jgi:hypothetical protein
MSNNNLPDGIVELFDTLADSLKRNRSDISVKRIDAGTIEVEADSLTRTVLVHEMAGTRSEGEPRYRIRVATPIDDYVNPETTEKHKNVLNRFAANGALVSLKDGNHVVAQCQLGLFPLRTTMELILHAIMAGPIAILNCLFVLEGVANELPNEKSDWDLLSFLPILNREKKWFHTYETQDDGILAGGKIDSGESYYVVIDKRTPHPGLANTGLIINLAFNNCMPEYKDRFLLTNTLNSMSFLHGYEPTLGAWYSDGSESLSYAMFLPDFFGKLEGIHEIVIWILVEQIYLILSGKAKQRVDEYLEIIS